MISTNSRHRELIVQIMNDEVDLPVGYIAGIIDAKGSVGVNIYQKDQYSIGYYPEPRLRVTSTNESLMGLLDAYAESRGVNAVVSELANDRYEWMVTGPDAVGTILNDTYPYVIEQSEKFGYYLESVLPFIADGDWHSEEGLIRLAEMVGGESSRRKYTPEYFREEFGRA